AVQAGSISVASINSVVTGAASSSNLGVPSGVANGTIKIGAATVAGTLIYTGGGETSDRVIDLSGTSGGAVIQNDGTGALTFTPSTGSFTATGAGTKSLTLQGSYTTASNTINGIIVNNTSVNKTNVVKAGNVTWTLAGVNTYTGTTTVNLGTLKAGGTSNT